MEQVTAKGSPMRHVRLATSLMVLASLVMLAIGSGLALAQGAADQATPQYAAAVQLQNHGSYDLAEQAWSKFLQQFKGDPRAGKAMHYLGVCYYQQKKYDQAITTFQNVIQTYPQLEALDATYLYLGVTQYTQAQNNKPELFDAAIETFQTLTTKYPQGRFVPDAQFYRAECLYARGKKAEAIEAYRQFVTNYPDDKRQADALYALGVAQEEQAQTDDAAATYDRFLKKFPKSPLAVEVGMRRGETFFAAGQYDEAAKWFAAAAATKGFVHADYALLRQADSLAQLKQRTEAAALYASMAEKFPKSEHLGRALLAGGKSYHQAGNPAEARKLLEKVLSAGGPHAVEAAHWLAKIALKEHQAQEALTAVEKVLSQADKSPYAAQLLMDQADALYELPERRKESIAAYAAVASRYPKSPVAAQALYMAGFAALEQGDSATALKQANAFLSAYPKHDLTPDVVHVAAESQLLLGKVAEADKRYAELLEKYPAHGNVELWTIRRGLALALQKKHSEAIGLLQPALASLRTPTLVAEAQYLIGSGQLELKQEAEAIKSLEASLAADPKWRQADETLLALAGVYRRQNDLDKVKAALQKLIADFPASPILDKALFRLGEAAYVSGDYPAAAAAHRQVVDKWPQSPLVPHALHELGCAELAQKQPAAAEKTLGRLLHEFPKHPLAAQARYTRGMARYQQANYAPAVEDLQAMLKADPQAPEQADARYVLGLSQMGLKQFDAAQATFQTLLDQKPPYSGADNVLYQLAWAQKLSGDEEQAAKTFAELAQKHAESPRVAEALYHVGEAAYKNKDYDKAVESYYAVIQKAGKSELGEKAGHKLAWTYYHQGDFQRAQQTFHFQQTTYPHGPLAADAELMVAECLFKQNKYQEALDAFEKLKRPATPDLQALALLHAGQAAGQLKQWDKSLELLIRCIKEFPDSPHMPEALYEQGWTQQNLDKRAEALALYQQVIAKAPNREVAARAQFMIGEIEFSEKNHAEAVNSFFKVVYGYSYPKWQAEATYEAARCLEVLQKKDQAVKLYRELLEKYPASDKIPQAKERLQQLTG
jgi:tol-pal system protein YbgF